MRQRWSHYCQDLAQPPKTDSSYTVVLLTLLRLWITPKLVHTMSITPHANGEPLLKQSSSYSHSLICNDSACCLQTATVVLLLPRPSGLIEQGAHYIKKTLDLLDEESASGESSGRASLLIRREVLPVKVSRSLKYDSK